jgi:hypothetical protein
MLGILNDRIVCIARQRERPAHDVVQADSFRVGEEVSLSQNDREAQNSVERRDIEGLLSLQHLLCAQLMFRLIHASFLSDAIGTRTAQPQLRTYVWPARNLDVLIGWFWGARVADRDPEWRYSSLQSGSTAIFHDRTL